MSRPKKLRIVSPFMNVNLILQGMDLYSRSEIDEPSSVLLAQFLEFQLYPLEPILW